MARDERPAIARLDGPLSTDGYSVVHVGFGYCKVPGCTCTPEPVPWSYTYGLAARGQPELVMMGLEPWVNHEVIGAIVERRSDGEELPVGADVFVELDTSRPFRIAEVPDAWVLHDPARMTKWFEWNRRRFGTLPTVQQVLWPDSCWRFPGHPDHDPRGVQPVLADDPISFPRTGNREARRAARRRWAA
jgi:hypothetical protein